MINYIHVLHMRSMVQNLKEGGGGAKNRILENYQIAYLTVQ